MATTLSKATIVQAPDRPALPGTNKSIFLAGTTHKDAGDWRATLCKALQHHPVTIFNPLRLDWNWSNDMSDSRFSEQVTWELDMQEAADLVVVLFHHSTAAPISLLEFGLAARSGKVIAACLESDSKRYENKGNVQAVCARFQIQLLETQEDLHAAVVKFLAE
ncbi:hypothetical protein BN1723_012778, partial [Verticillium longisporum]